MVRLFALLSIFCSTFFYQILVFENQASRTFRIVHVYPLNITLYVKGVILLKLQFYCLFVIFFCELVIQHRNASVHCFIRCPSPVTAQKVAPPIFSFFYQRNECILPEHETTHHSSHMDSTPRFVAIAPILQAEARTPCVPEACVQEGYFPRDPLFPAIFFVFGDFRGAFFIINHGRASGAGLRRGPCVVPHPVPCVPR